MTELSQYHIKKIAGILDEIERKITDECEGLSGKIYALGEKIERHLLEGHASGRPALRVIIGGKKD
jgi:hypothetical protein